MRLRLVIAILAGGQHLLASGQSPFNARYDLLGQPYAQEAWGVEADSIGGAMVFFNGPYWQDGFYASSGVASVRVYADGSASEGFRHHVPDRANYPGWSNCSTRLQDGGYFIGGGTYQNGDTHRVAMYWFDDVGIITNFREIDYLPGQAWIGRQAKQTTDGGFVICGETSQPGPINNGSQPDAFVLKTDAQGNQEWVQTYGAANRFEKAKSIDLTDGGGYFVGGTVSTTSLLITDRQVFKINAQGAVQWSRSWGTVQSDGPALVTTAADGHVLVAGSKGNTPEWFYRPYLAKLNKNNGSTIWERGYGDSLNSEGYFTVVQEVTPGGDLITGGSTLTNEPVLGIMYRGSLLRTTNTGDSLWMRYYDYYDANVSDGRGYFRDVQPTSDGGFIAVGQALPAGPYTSDVWVVKVDGHGCLEPGCHLITGMETQITNLRGALTVAPNPVVSGGAVQVSIALPENFKQRGALKLTVVSSDGRIVKEATLPEAVCSLNFHLSDFASGLYHVHLSDDARWVSGAKLVVE